MPQLPGNPGAGMAATVAAAGQQKPNTRRERDHPHGLKKLWANLIDFFLLSSCHLAPDAIVESTYYSGINKD